MQYKFSTRHWILCNYSVDLSDAEVDVIVQTLIYSVLNARLARKLLPPALKAKLTRANRAAVRYLLQNEPLNDILKSRFNIKNNQGYKIKLPEIEKLLMEKDRELIFPLALTTQAWLLYLNDLKELPQDEGFVLGQYMAISNVTFGKKCLIPVYLTKPYHERTNFHRMFYFDGFRYQNKVREIIGKRTIFEGIGLTAYSSEIGYMYGLFVLLYDQLLQDVKCCVTEQKVLSTEDIIWLDNPQRYDIRRLRKIASVLGIDYSPEHLIAEIKEGIQSSSPEIYTMTIPQILVRHRDMYKFNKN